MKTTLVHLRLEQDKIEALDALAGEALTRQAVARMILLAGLEAIRRNQGRLKFPPAFSVSENEPVNYRLNEPKPEKRK